MKMKIKLIITSFNNKKNIIKLIVNLINSNNYKLTKEIFKKEIITKIIILQITIMKFKQSIITLILFRGQDN